MLLLVAEALERLVDQRARAFMSTSDAATARNPPRRTARSRSASTSQNGRWRASCELPMRRSERASNDRAVLGLLALGLARKTAAG